MPTLRVRHPYVRILAATACLASMGAPHAALAAACASGPAAKPAQALSVKDAAGLDAAIAERLDALRAKQGAWQWRDFIDRGRAAVGQGDFAGAATAFEAASQSAPDEATRLMSDYCWANSLIASAQALPPVDNAAHPRRAVLLAQAGGILNGAQRVAPLSRDIAAARVTAWSSLGDELELAAAEHQMRVIDPSMEGTPRCEPATAMLVVALVVFVAGRYTLHAFEFKGHLTPEQRLLVLQLMDKGARVAGGILSGREPIDVFTTELTK
jgi:hypothetical protein